MKTFVYTLVCLITVYLPSAAFIGSGSGTSGDPYLVSTAAELNDVRNDLTAAYRQTADIDLSGYSNWSKIGTTITAGTNFTGTYDGSGYKITGLSITSTTDLYNGLFGVIGSGGTVKNLGVTGASLSGSTAGLGILAGYNFGGTVENCYTTGTVTTSQNNPGGLLGVSSGTVTKCYSTAAVTATGATSNNVGGLIGAGLTNGGSISQCYSAGNVSNNNTSGTYNTGGFIGIAAHAISDCYSTGNVSSSTGGRAGGFIGGTGTGTPVFTNCYSTGLVTCPTKGGFVGFVNTGSFSNCLFNYETAGTSTACGTGTPGGTIAAQTTTEMQTQSTFTGWNFTSIWEIVSGFSPRLISIPDPALPVELTSFAATAGPSAVMLMWHTAAEVNNYGFEIERRAVKSEREAVKSEEETVNGWKKIGFVAGNGTSNTPNEYSYSDATVSSGSYVYRLKQIDHNGASKYSDAVEVSFLKSEEFSLGQNYPNPFNPATTVTYTVPGAGMQLDVSLKVYDILGKEVATLVNETKESGSYTVNFHASHLASGVYYYRLHAGSFTGVKKLILMK